MTNVIPSVALTLEDRLPKLRVRICDWKTYVQHTLDQHSYTGDFFQSSV